MPTSFRRAAAELRSQWRCDTVRLCSLSGAPAMAFLTAMSDGRIIFCNGISVVSVWHFLDQLGENVPCHTACSVVPYVYSRHSIYILQSGCAEKVAVETYEYIGSCRESCKEAVRLLNCLRDNAAESMSACKGTLVRWKMQLTLLVSVYKQDVDMYGQSRLQPVISREQRFAVQVIML